MQGWLSACRRFVELGGAAAALIFLPALILVSGYDIVGRRLFHFSSTLLQELAWHFFFGCVMFAIGYTYIQERHVRVDILRERLPARIKRRLERILLTVLLLPFCLILFWFGAEMTWLSFVQGEGSRAALGLSARWIVKSALPVCALLLFLAGIYRFAFPTIDRGSEL